MYVFWILAYSNILCISSENRTTLKIPIHLSLAFSYCTAFTDSQWALILHTLQVNMNSACLLCAVTPTPSPSFSSRSGAYFYGNLAYQTQHYNSALYISVSGSVDNANFFVRVLQSELTKLRSDLLSGELFFLIPLTLIRRKKRWHVNGELLFLANIVLLHLCKEYLTLMKFKPLFSLLIWYWTLLK